MMTIEQFKAWKEIVNEDAEFADEVLRYFRNIVMPLPSEEEAITDLIEDEGSEELPLGIANSPIYGRADEVAKKIAGVA